MSGSLKDAMLLSQREYKKAAKDAKSNNNAAAAERMNNAEHSKNLRHFWKTRNNNINKLSVGNKDNLHVDLFGSSFKENFIDSENNIDACK